MYGTCQLCYFALPEAALNLKEEEIKQNKKSHRGSGHLVSLLFWQWFNNNEASACRFHEHLCFQNRRTGGENSYNHTY